jgi:hypothetical protein
MNTRSLRAEVRNPLLRFDAAAELAALPPEAREALRKLASEASAAWRVKAEECWKSHKPPMAAYWKAWAVNARHLALLCRKGAP